LCHFMSRRIQPAAKFVSLSKQMLPDKLFQMTVYEITIGLFYVICYNSVSKIDALTMSF
jgi:hypothetical protein